jgi:hypothetical protein
MSRRSNKNADVRTMSEKIKDGDLENIMSKGKSKMKPSEITIGYIISDRPSNHAVEEYFTKRIEKLESDEEELESEKIVKRAVKKL